MARHKDLKQLGKLIAYVLGRRPDEFGLVPDDEGFVRQKDLVKAISEEPGWGFVRRSHIHEVLITCPDNPFIAEDDRIKVAHPGLAIKRVKGVVPPKLVYHCVRRKAYPVVCRKGIIPMGQPHVFLATTKELAIRMGKRRDPDPVLLTVYGKMAFDSGVNFSRQGELIYVVDHIPIKYFVGPPLPKEKKETGERHKEPSLIPDMLPGSFLLDMERSEALQHQRLKRKGRKREIAWKKTRRVKRKQGWLKAQS